MVNDQWMPDEPPAKPEDMAAISMRMVRVCEVRCRACGDVTQSHDAPAKACYYCGSKNVQPWGERTGPA